MLSLQYLKRIVSAYILNSNSQLSFWHETPAINPESDKYKLGSYYMKFAEKAEYAGPFDAKGIPLLDYKGTIGKQYNPIAIAQYSLGNYNVYCGNKDSASLNRAVNAAEWLVDNLQQNSNSLWVWHHHFDWEYFRTLKSPWYSGLAQGQGISALLRVYAVTSNEKYMDAARKAFESLLVPVEHGGVLYTGPDNYWWIEEYIVDPPTHILNGFIWGLWGVYDYMLVTGDSKAEQLWQESLKTIIDNTHLFDTGYWSLYDLSQTAISNVASNFYHSLHIVQLRIMHRLTDNKFFGELADRWESYRNNPLNRKRAFIKKAVFKIAYF